MNPLENWIVRFCVWDFNWKLGFILEKKNGFLRALEMAEKRGSGECIAFSVQEFFLFLLLLRGKCQKFPAKQNF